MLQNGRGWLRFLPVVLAGLAFCSAPAAGQTWCHDPGSVGDWYDPNNWIGGVPGLGSEPVIRNGGTAEISHGQANFWVGVSNGSTLIESGTAELLQFGVQLSGGGRCIMRDDAFINIPFGIGWVEGGEFIQEGGRCIFNELDAMQTTYRLSGGVLEGNAAVLWQDQGQFIQTGGRVENVEGIILTGLYTLSGTGVIEDVGDIFLKGYGGVPAEMLQSGGENHVWHLRIGSYGQGTNRYVISGGELNCGIIIEVGNVSNQTSGEFSVTSPNAVIHTGYLNFNYGSTFSAVPGARIELAWLTNNVSDPVPMAGLGNVNLVFTSLNSKLEVAGVDLGPVAEGWTNNFAVGTITIGAGSPARLRLQDLSDNLPGDEALYVDNLLIGSGGGLNLNGLPLYFRNGGTPKRLFPGDTDLDGDVDFTNYQILESNFGGTIGMGWTDGDFNGDGTVDFTDYQLLEADYGNNCPEPGFLGFLFLLAVPAFHRKR